MSKLMMVHTKNSKLFKTWYYLFNSFFFNTSTLIFYQGLSDTSATVPDNQIAENASRPRGQIGNIQNQNRSPEVLRVLPRHVCMCKISLEPPPFPNPCPS